MGDAQQIRVEPVTPAIGAEMLGIDLTQITAGLIEDVRAALLEHKVVFFRDQKLSPQQHIDFAQHFGELEVHPATPKAQENPEVLRIEHGPNSRGSENMWHSDVTWREQPSLGSVLRAIEVPQLGGDTLFANMALAYDRLSEATRERISGRIAVHDIARVFARRLKKTPEELHEQYPLMEHPIVRTHPETKQRVVYVNGAFTSHIKDMDDEESKLLLDELFKSAWNPEVQCRFKWRANSIAFWDNRVCQHFATSDYFPAVRKMERVTIAGDRPYFDA
ncbi:taurine dioxygenase [Halieaceae bacterium IMCC14734]|uniref:Taurine dioxygenase n=1 Tax=Candidatus Litorirhabdus singularis TaxID=2518993 RepID=A0ABT3TJT8_9GAMM|nr:TauD/TfdA family dioxygenase [Candidatus Litorirhabdus singularis]MCX2982055.1 taurine dioxygenase [Candidatus Litorirhabdus singularis]